MDIRTTNHRKRRIINKRIINVIKIINGIIKRRITKRIKAKKEKGMFGGLHGAFGGGNANGNNKQQQQQQQFDDASDSDDLIEECECHSVDGNPKATPAAARNAYTQEDDDEQENVQCRQM